MASTHTQEADGIQLQDGGAFTPSGTTPGGAVSAAAAPEPALSFSPLFTAEGEAKGDEPHVGLNVHEAKSPRLSGSDVNGKNEAQPDQGKLSTMPSLLEVCNDVALTLTAIHAAGSEAAAQEKDGVSDHASISPCKHPPYNDDSIDSPPLICVCRVRTTHAPSLLLSAVWFCASASSLQEQERDRRDDPRIARAQPGRRQGEDFGTSSPPPPLTCVCRLRTTHAPSLALVRSMV